MNKVIVKRGPDGHWYSGKVGQSFNVLGYDDNVEAYLVEVLGYTGRYIYKQDCYDVSTTFDADFTLSPKITDSVVEDVVQMFRDRSEAGIKKYGTTLDRTDLSLEQWIQNALEEHMDAILYLRRILKELKP